MATFALANFGTAISGAWPAIIFLPNVQGDLPSLQGTSH